MFRHIISVTLLVSLLALGSSGILMIILGSFEFNLQMHPVHKIFGVLLSVSGCVHLYLNFGAIKKYLKAKRLAIFAGVMTVLMVFLYAVGMNKPLDPQKIKQIEAIMMTMEG